MDINILVLDNLLGTAGTEILTSLSPLIPVQQPSYMRESRPVGSLNGGAPLTLTLQEMDGEEVKLTFVCNPSDDARQVKELLEKGHFQGEFDLVLLDDHWGHTAAEKFAGQTMLLEPTFKYVNGRAGAAPLICLWTQHWDEEYRTGLLAQTLRRQPFWGENRVRGLSKTNYPGLLLLVQDVIAVSRLQQRNAELEKQLKRAHEAAAQHLDLLKSKQFTESIVTHGPFLRIAERLEPFFQWRNGIYQSLPDVAKMGFPPGLLFRGMDDVWVGTVCETLVEALGSEAYTVEAHDLLVRDAGDWEELFTQEVAELYSAAMQESVVVIRADRIAWPAEVESAKMHATWHLFVSKICSFLRGAAEINGGGIPTDRDLRSQIFAGRARAGEGESPFAGKILWLLAYGAHRDDGLLAPVEAMLRPAIRLDFPQEDRVRRDFLRLYARKRQCQFTARALRLAVKRTRGYNFSDLIGEAQFTGGSFLSLAEGKAKLEASKRLGEAQTDEERNSIRAIITEEIVEDVLGELELNDDSSPPATQLGDVAEPGVPRGRVAPARAEEKEAERLKRAEQKLDWLQVAATQAKQESPDIKTTQLRATIAQILKIKPGNLSQYAREYENEFKSLFRDPNNEGRWDDLSQMITFKRFLP